MNCGTITIISHLSLSFQIDAFMTSNCDCRAYLLCPVVGPQSLQIYIFCHKCVTSVPFMLSGNSRTLVEEIGDKLFYCSSGECCRGDSHESNLQIAENFTAYIHSYLHLSIEYYIMYQIFLLTIITLFNVLVKNLLLVSSKITTFYSIGCQHSGG